MVNTPNINTNPILTALITIVVVIGVFVGGIVAGYYLRVNQEDSANLGIVTDDERASKTIDSKEVAKLGEAGTNAEILNSYENDWLEKCGKCLNTPYTDDMYIIMQSDRDFESGDFD